ncbi:unnamed protein product [Miscanthus lutarioriparius]|uniref:Cytochrome P450 n=1 Tax=Miscanthus lutarioriparius TaxID=422564 RepID=A0A811QD14_9POAL|nr:unnamed protein product [Miscanthus lutarioriparius]
MADKVVVAVAVAVLVVVLSLAKLKSWLCAKPKPKLHLPPGPWTLPVIGSLHHLMSSPLLHRTLRRLSQKHGPLMMLRLGEVPLLVVSSPEAAQEILKTHDTTFADRITSATTSSMTYNPTNMALSPYGERWRQLRKICVMELLSAARVQSFRRTREEEAARLVAKVAASAAVASSMDMSAVFKAFISDTITRECVGSRSQYHDVYVNAFHEAIRHSSGLSVADVFPSSRIMQMLATGPRNGLACRDRMQRILELVLKEKKEAMDRGDQTVQETFVGVLLRLQKEGDAPIELTDGTICSLMFDMLSAGSDTSTSVLTWCMTELIRYPTAMAKVQAEVRETFKGMSRVTEEDIATADISYLKLVIKETLRMHTQLPLLIPRRCRKACQVMGYDIPEGTTVMVNVWAICRNPKYWDDPEEFKPERFENSNLQYKGTNYEYLPFGSGRRMCPGANLGLANVNLALVSLLYHFDWKLCDGLEPKDVDVSEDVGLVTNKKTSLVLCPVTRIAPADV